MDSRQMTTEALCRQMIAEGSVLLKNENILPLKKGERVAVFGRCQINTYYSGMGSGGLVNRAYQINLIDGLHMAGQIQIDENVAEVYRNWVEAHPYNNGDGAWAQEPWYQEEMPIDDLAAEAAQRNDKAIVIIGRTAGEDKDGAYKPGSWLLTQKEKELLEKVTAAFENVVLLFNIGGIMDMSFLEDPKYQGHLKAAVLCWQGGQETGNGMADVLCGLAVPSGKLPDTVAYHINDYYTTRNFGDEFANYYEEDIYVGYRYFETFCPKRVQFPFGHGLSYTTFAITPGKAVKDPDTQKTEFSVKVKNTGDTYSAKEVVQLYVEAPQGMLGKPVRALAGFQKTPLLAPGEETELRFSVSEYEYASYDDSGVTGHPYAYVLEKGTYRFHIGSSIRNTQLLQFADGSNVLEETKVVEQLEQALAPERSFERIHPVEQNGQMVISKEAVPVGQTDLLARIQSRVPEAVPITGNQGWKLADAVDGNCSWKEFIAQFSEEDLAAIVRAEGMANPKVTPGTGGAMGGVTDQLLQYHVPLICGSDGPNGIRMDSGNYATQIPTGGILASSWNEALVETICERVGQECEREKIDILFGPGMNIHRSPLNGRNFEYFSEDPYLNGKTAAAYTRGIQNTGAFCSLKHFAGNTQEGNRNFVDTVASERALREIYLKGFEIAVREGHAGVMMTTYCPLNGFWTATNYDLCTTLLRKEWGFEGVVITDWWARLNHVVDRGMPNFTDTASMIRAQNDFYCVVENYGAAFNTNQDNTLEEYHKNNLTLGEMQRNAENICRFAARTFAYRRPVDVGGKTLHYRPLADRPECECVHKLDRCTTVQIDFTKERKHLLELSEDAVFQVWFTYRCKGHGVTQSSMNVTMNEENFLTLVVNGTGNEWRKVRLLNVSLPKGIYLAEGHFPKLGMDTDGLLLIPAMEEDRNEI